MFKYIKTAVIITALLSSFCLADEFKHRLSGDKFYGYATQVSREDQTKVYVKQGENFTSKTINITEYEIKYSKLGRKNNIIVLPLNYPSVLRSESISKLLAKTIVHASNAGPLFVILEIDSPGGNCEYMLNVTKAIKETSNCPVYAFITGEKYLGAYSAAAGVALACDKIFISPKASIGTFAPTPSGTVKAPEVEWHEIYSPVQNGTYTQYMSDLCKDTTRPAAIAVALVDADIEVIEVITNQLGSRNIIDKDKKKPGDTIAKTWSKEYKPTVTIDSNKSFTVVQNMQITLSADDAIYTRMADSIAASRDEVIEELKSSDAKVTVTNRLRTHALNFEKNVTRVKNLFIAIEELEADAQKVEKEYEKVASASLNNLSNIEEERLRRIQQQLYRNQIRNNKRRLNRNTTNYLTPEQIEQIERELQNSYVNPYTVRQNQIIADYVYILEELQYAYSSVLTIVKNYPGTMPKDKSPRELTMRLNQITAKLNQIMYNQQIR